MTKVAKRTKRFDLFDMAVFVADHITWSSRVFTKPGEEHSLRLPGVLEHIKREIEELRSKKGDWYELADILILCIDYMWRAGWSISQVLHAYFIFESHHGQQCDYLSNFDQTLDQIELCRSRLLRDPDNIEYLAGMIFWCLHYCHDQKWPIESLWKTMEHKQQINFARDWGDPSKIAHDQPNTHTGGE